MTIERIASRIGLARLTTLIPAFARADAPPPQTLWAFMAWAMRGGWWVIGVTVLISVVTGTFEVLAAILLGRVIDLALETGAESVFATHGWFLLFLVVFVVVLRPLAYAASSAMQSLAVAPNLNVLALSRLHRWTMGQAITFFDNDFAGRLAQKQMQSSRAIADIVIEAVNSVVFAVSSVVAAGILLMSINPWIGVLLALWVVGYARFIAFFMPRIRVRSKARAASRSAVSGQVVDTITNMRTVKLFASSEHEDRAAIKEMDRFRDASLSFGYVSVTFRYLLMTIAGLLPAVLIGVVLWLWTIGQATPGEIAATGTVSLRIAQMTGWVSFTLMGIYANIGEVEDGMRTLSPGHALTDAEGAAEIAPAPSEAGIAFEDVTFTYGENVGGLRGVDLTVAPGEKVGIVGASGAGKSTLVSVLLRLYDVERGTVRVAGHDVREVSQESLRAAIGMVTQDTAMFNRSARDNIAYGRPEATDAEVEAAAAKAEAHEFVGALRDFKGREGYAAHLGERGVKLSGGQRQRIALARAILKDAPILVLDEATSALDSEVEAEIQEALEQVMAGKTVLAIAHRLSTVARMDRIVVMAEGRIVEQGTHASLLEKGGIYARFWHRQSGGFLGLAAE